MPQKRTFICESAFDWLLKTLDKDQAIATLAQKNTAEKKAFIKLLCMGGFKLNAAIFCKRYTWLFSLFQRDRKATEFFLTLFQKQEGTWQPLAESLDDIALKRSWRTFLQLSAEPGIFILALACHPEQSWQWRLACRLLAIPDAWKGRQDAVGDKTPPFHADAFGKLLGIDLKSTADESEEREWQNRCEAEYRRGRQDERMQQEQKAAEERKIRDRRIKDLEAELDNAKSELLNAQKTLNATVRGADARLQEQKTRLNAQFQRSVDNLFQQYFAEDHTLEYQAQEGMDETEALLERLDSAARMQRSFNATHGSKQRLKEQRRALATALDALQKAAADAVTPVKGLPALMAEASAKIKHIESILADDDVMSLAASQLHATILSIKLDSQAEQLFQNCRQFIEQAEEHDILSPDEASFLQDTVTRRQTLFQTAPATKAMEQNLAQMPAEQKRVVPAEIWNLAQYQKNLHRVTLIFDAYNAMKRNAVWFRMETQKSFDEARRHFIQRCRLKQDCFQNTILVFDGADSIISREKVSEKLSLVFAPQLHDAHNADDTIVATASALKASGDADLIWVVTNDYDLRKRLEDFCDAFVETRAIPPFFLA